MIILYWNVGKYISYKLNNAEWGEKVVQQLADFLKTEEPDLQGFSRRSLFKMKQFYETYKVSEIVVSVTPLLEKSNSEIVPTVSALFDDISNSLITRISWSHHTEILNKAKIVEEREYYILLAIKEK